MSLKENYSKIAGTVPSGVKLVAVSKYKTADEIREVYDCGHRVFGENKAQEMKAKQAVLPADIEWHFIGHLQSNKIKYIAPYVSLIQSIDSFDLLRAVNKEALKCGRVIPCLLQFHIAKEETKFGLVKEEADEMLGSSAFSELKNVRIDGVMGMATFTDNQTQVRSEFASLRAHFEYLRDTYFSGPDGAHFKEISMGMSDDYLPAIAEGSTIVRVGSAIFGPRDYSLKLY